MNLGVTPEQRAALLRHGYPADLRPCGMTGRPDQVFEGLSGRYGEDGEAVRELLRTRVCELDGIKIDGHGGSDLDPGSTYCIYCHCEGPNP